MKRRQNKAYRLFELPILTTIHRHLRLCVASFALKVSLGFRLVMKFRILNYGMLSIYTVLLTSLDLFRNSNCEYIINYIEPTEDTMDNCPQYRFINAP